MSRFKRKLLGSSLDGSRGDKGDKRAGGDAGGNAGRDVDGNAGTSRSKDWRAPLNIPGSKDRPAKRSASPRAMLGVDGRA